MRERPLSASSIKTYLQCLLKYYYRYEDKKPRPGKTGPLAFGIAMHEALEYMHKVVSENGTPPSPDVYTRVIDVFMRSATNNGLDDLSIYQEGRDILTARLDAVNPEEKILGLELQFELKTTKGTPFLGSIDKLIELDEDTVVIIDYKTSRFALPQEEVDSDIQLSMYDLAVSMLYPQYKTIICVLDYLRMSEVISHRNAEQRQMFVDFIDAVYADICDTEENDVQATLNSFCPWCEYKDYCPEYQKVITDPDLILPPVGSLSDEDFVDGWDRIAAAKKIIDARQREFKSDAYHRMRSSETIRGSKREIYKTQSSRMVYDTKTVFNIMGQDQFVKSASVSKQAVDKFLKDNPEHIEAAEETALFSFMSPAFRVRKIKKSN